MIHGAEKVDRRELERCVLGAMLLSPAAAEFAIGELSALTFSNSDLRAIFTAVSDMLASGVPCDPMTLGEQLAKRGELAAAGGALGIAEVIEAVPHSGHVRHYVRQLEEQHQRDSLQLLSERQKYQSQDPTCEPSELIDAMIGELEALRAGNARQSELKTAAEAMQEADQRNNNPAKVIRTGLPELDRQLHGGMRPGQLIVFGGRPGLGKSALMSQIIFNAGLNRRPELIASLEMTSGEIAERSLMTIDREKFVQLPVLFAECFEFARLVSLIRLARRRSGIELAAVDYLQLIETPVSRNELRERQVATMSRGLKRLAMELQIPILLGSQLNRESEKRGRPSLADLRESGAIEQDADIVVLISGDAETNERELIVAKHRGGPCGLVSVTFDRPNFRFESEPWTGAL